MRHGLLAARLIRKTRPAFHQPDGDASRRSYLRAIRRPTSRSLGPRGRCHGVVDRQEPGRSRARLSQPEDRSILDMDSSDLARPHGEQDGNRAYNVFTMHARLLCWSGTSAHSWPRTSSTTTISRPQMFSCAPVMFSSAERSTMAECSGAGGRCATEESLKVHGFRTLFVDDGRLDPPHRQIYEYLEPRGITLRHPRLKANAILQRNIAHLLGLSANLSVRNDRPTKRKSRFRTASFALKLRGTSASWKEI